MGMKKYEKKIRGNQDQKTVAKQQKGQRHRDYQQYQFRFMDWMEYIFWLLLKGGFICYLFYDSPKAAILLIPMGILDYRRLKKKKLEKQKQELTLQFKSMIEAIATSLNAGYSLEHSFEAAKKDLSLAYNGQAFIFEELSIILSGLKMNIPLERLLKDFGERSGIDDIRNFANVVMVAKKSGGNLIRIIQKTVNSIGDKISVEQEIETMISAKKLEEKIMLVMPYGIILYLRISSGDFLQVLYHNLLGIMLMTTFLILIYIAQIWADKIMEIQV